MKLRVLSYNIHKCKGMDGRVRPQRIAEVLEQLKADVIALQEVLGLDDPNGEDQSRFLAQQIWPTAYGDILRQEQISYMLNLFYSPDALMDQMKKLKHSFTNLNILV